MAKGEKWPLWDVFLSHGGYRKGSGGVETHLYVRNNERLSSIGNMVDEGKEPSFKVPVPDVGKMIHANEDDLRRASERIASRLRYLEGRLGIAEWSLFQNSLAIFPEQDKKKTKPVYSLCPIYISGDIGDGHLCGRPVYDDGEIRCGLHRGAAERSRHADEKRRKEREERREEDQRRRLKQDEIRELWAMACESRDVMHPGERPTMASESRATVDSEVLAMFLREIIDRG